MNYTYNPGRPFKLTSPYGDRADPNKPNTREFHAGVDYAAPAGTPIPAATSGVVIYSGRNPGFGNTVVVRNATGDYSLYAHMQDGDRAKVGQRVWLGDTIGQVGSTGEKARGNHLHYSIIPASLGKDIENRNLPRDGGPIGIGVASDAPALAPAPAPPLLGIFSGKPMPNRPVPPPIFQPKDQTSPDDDELYQRWRRWLDA